MVPARGEGKGERLSLFPPNLGFRMPPKDLDCGGPRKREKEGRKIAVSLLYKRGS